MPTIRDRYFMYIPYTVTAGSVLHNILHKPQNIINILNFWTLSKVDIAEPNSKNKYLPTIRIAL